MTLSADRPAAWMDDRDSEASSQALFDLCGAIAENRSWDGGPALAEAERERFFALAKAAGLEGTLYSSHLARAGALSSAESPRLNRSRDLQCLRSAMAMRQLEELAAAFGREGIPLIALKGGAALAWLYRKPELREVVDLDILVPDKQIDATKALLEQLGYRAEPENLCDAADQLALLNAAHLPPYRRERSLPIEVHTRLDPRSAARPIEDVWKRARCGELRNGSILRLAWPDFALHTLLHYLRHFELCAQKSPARLKGMVDLLLLMNYPPAFEDGLTLSEAADLWDARPEFERVASTLREIWGVELDPAFAGGQPIPRRNLLRGRGDEIGEPTNGYALRKTGKLPTVRARSEYLARRLWPSPAHMRWREGLAPDQPVFWPTLRFLARRIARRAGGSGRREGPEK